MMATKKDFLKDVIEHIDIKQHNVVPLVEAMGFKHYKGTPFSDDNELRELHIDRIYDTYIDEDELRICDETTAKIFNSLKPRPYSSRELLWEFGKYLEDQGGPKVDDS